MSYNAPEITVERFNQLPHANNVFPYLEDHPLEDTVVEKLRCVP
jgi:hypothetical protein